MQASLISQAGSAETRTGENFVVWKVFWGRPYGGGKKFLGKGERETQKHSMRCKIETLAGMGRNIVACKQVSRTTNSCNFSAQTFNSFHVPGLFSNILKTSANLWFYDVFMGYRNGLKDTPSSEFSFIRKATRAFVNFCELWAFVLFSKSRDEIRIIVELCLHQYFDSRKIWPDPASNCMFNVNNRNTTRTRCEIC